MGIIINHCKVLGPPGHTVDGINPRQPPGMVLKPVVHDGINYQPQLVQDFFHQQYVNDFC